jgi:hypothetical protein
MTRIIGFTGSHGTGKTSTLDAIARRQYPNIIVDDYKASRTVLKELKCTLEQATSTPTIMQIFQDRILDTKIHRDGFTLPNCVHRSAKTNFLVDRTPADIYAYTVQWVHKLSEQLNGTEFEELMEWQAQFVAKCVEGIKKYDMIIHFPINAIPFVDDGIRAKIEDQEHVGWYIGTFLKGCAVKYHTVKSISIEDRVDEIIGLLQ